MALGDWRNALASWFTEALVESAVLDGMTENQYNLLIATGILFCDKRDQELDAVIGFTGVFDLDDETTQTDHREIDFVFYLHDGEPWTRMVFRLWAQTAPVTGTIVGYRRDPTGAGVGTTIFTKNTTDLTPMAWNTVGIVDITGWSPGPYSIGVEFDGTLVYGPVQVYLTHELFGVVV